MPVTFTTVGIALLALSGCSAEPTTGTVHVEVRGDSSEGDRAPLAIEILNADGEVVAQAALSEGMSRQFDDVPLGWTTITAEGSCTLEAPLTATGLKAIFEPQHCEITDP